LIKAGKAVKGAKVAILGFTFKENCPDTRNSKVFDIVKELREYGIEPVIADPEADSEEAKRLEEITRLSFFEGIKFAKEGYRVQDISAAVQTYVESHGFSVVREFVGHGVGTHLHESPEIPNFGRSGRGARLLRGMTLAIEPMVNLGGAAILQMNDGWTVKTRDGKLSAHYENMILVTDGEPEILTAPAI
jgi:methionyl aminopeptidase